MSSPGGVRSWLAAGQRAAKESRLDFLPDRAATLTYYGVLAIFPGLLVLVSLLGLIGKQGTQSLINDVADAAPGAVRHTFLDAVNHLQQNQASAGTAAVIGLLAGLWSASSYIGAFMRAANGIYGVPEGRPFWKTLAIRVALTVTLIVLLIASAFIVVVTGGIARRLGDLIGAGSVAVTVWDIAKWPVLLFFVILILAILYWASPNARQKFRWFSPGSLIAVPAWLIASGLFALYVANFAHYNRVYGSIAAVIIFLIWLWISNLAVLFGVEFNAEMQRGQAMADGSPPESGRFAQLRDTAKLPKQGAGEQRAAQQRPGDERAGRPAE
ncbi:MAG TPA: YihY/virulence factor BrkB family protein [Streptosporangiaceae bacterium]